jgi:hypothetical protein
MHDSKQKKMKKRTIHFSPISTRKGAEGEKMRNEKGDTKRDLLIFLIPHLLFLIPHSSFVLPPRLCELCASA